MLFMLLTAGGKIIEKRDHCHVIKWLFYLQMRVLSEHRNYCGFEKNIVSWEM